MKKVIGVISIVFSVLIIFQSCTARICTWPSKFKRYKCCCREWCCRFFYCNINAYSWDNFAHIQVLQGDDDNSSSVLCFRLVNRVCGRQRTGNVGSALSFVRSVISFSLNLYIEDYNKPKTTD